MSNNNDDSTIDDATTKSPAQETSTEGADAGADAGTDSGGSGDEGKVTDWRQHARTWEQRAKDNKRSEEAAISRASEVEQRLQELMEKETAARLDVRRMSLAVDFGMTRDQAAKVFTASDEETLAAQEAAYRAGRDAAAPTSAESTVTRDEGSPGQPGPPKKDYKALAAELRKRA